MRYTYDGNVDALYVYLSDGMLAEQVEVGDVVVDLDPNRQVVGVEVVSARRGWDAEGVIRSFPLDAEKVAFLRFLSGVAWSSFGEAVTERPSVQTSGNNVLVTMG